MTMKTITATELYTKLKEGMTDKDILIDVRSANEFSIDHIQGAINMPQENIEALQEKLKSYDHIYTYCNSGNRSGQVCAALSHLDLPNLYNLEGGIAEWKRHKYPHFQKKGALPIIRQVHIIAGGGTLVGTLLGAFVSPWFYILPGCMGAGLLFAGVTGFCGMATLLGKMPWNR